MCRGERGNRGSCGQDPEDRKQVLEWSLEAALKLPKGSAYARHRIACLRKALGLLEST